MPSRNVLIQGVMTWADEQQPGQPAHPIVIPPGSAGPPVAGWPSVPGNWPSLPGQGGGQPGQPPGIWGPTDPRPGWGLPTPQPPQPPLGIWGPNDPRPGWGLPGNQPYPDQGLPGSQPRPDNTLPGSQPRPDQGLPPFPAHPIFLPPGSTPPVGEWPAPPEFQPIPGQPEGHFQWFYSPVYGWVLGKPSGEGGGEGEGGPHPDNTLPTPEGGGEPTSY